MSYSADWLDSDVSIFVDMCVRCSIHPLDLLACMFNESNAKSTARNPRDESKPPVAVGLIQFTKAWAGRDADLDAIRAKSVAEQLRLVEIFFKPYKGQLTSKAMVYLAMFLPAWLDRSPQMTTFLTAPSGPYAWAYSPNRSLDVGGKGYITLMDLGTCAGRAATGDRWNDLSGRVSDAMKSRVTEREIPIVGPDSAPVFVLPDEDEETKPTPD